MSRKLKALLILTLLVLVGAMSLKTVVASHGDGFLQIMASGGDGPVPPTPWK